MSTDCRVHDKLCLTLTIFLLMSLPSLSASSSSTDESVKKYFMELETAKTAVFYAECLMKTGNIVTGKVSLVFPVGEKRGLYIERNDRMLVVNSAVVLLEDGKWDMEDALGGLATIKRVSALVAELLGFPFRLAQPDRLKHVAISKPSKVCLEKVPD